MYWLGFCKIWFCIKSGLVLALVLVVVACILVSFIEILNGLYFSSSLYMLCASYFKCFFKEISTHQEILKRWFKFYFWKIQSLPKFELLGLLILAIKIFIFV